MAFLLPLIELGELIEGAVVAYEAAETGVAVAGLAEGVEAVAATEAVGGVATTAEVAAVAAEVAPEAMAVEDAVGVQEGMYYGEHELDAYEAEYMRLPTEDPVIDLEAEGLGYEYPRPFELDGPTGYARLPLEEGGVIDNEGNFLARLQDDPLLRNVITVGAGKAVLVAGFWYILDPITGAPVYAIAGDDPRVDAFMQALGYTESAKQAGQVVRDWFKHLFGYDAPLTPAGPSISVVSEGAPRRLPRPTNLALTLPDLSWTDNLTKMRYPKSSRKRPRLSPDVVMSSAPVSVPVAAPAPSRMILYKNPKRVYRRVSSFNRTLVRQIPLRIQRLSSNNTITYTIEGITGDMSATFTGSTTQSVGMNWASDCFGLCFKLIDFAEYTDLKAAFDQYRFKSVSVTILPNRDASVLPSGSLIPVICVAEDRDDINVSGSTADKIMAKDGMKFVRTDEPYTFRCRPTAWTQDSLNVPKTKILGGWLPTAADSCLHFGVKGAPLKLSLTQDVTYSYTLIVKVGVECKHQD